MSTRSRNVTDLTARLLLGGLFVWAAAWHLFNWNVSIKFLVE